MDWGRESSRGRIFSGILFLAVGVVFLLANLEGVALRPLLMRWWPLLLLAIGVRNVLDRPGRAGLMMGTFWIGAGALFLADTLGYAEVPILATFWPLTLIWLGIAVAVGALGCSRRIIGEGDRS
jgi:hypothetical protein